MQSLLALFAMFTREQDRYFLWAPVVLAVGIATYFALGTEPEWWWGIPGLIVAAIISWRFRFAACNGGIVLLLIATGFVAGQIETARYAAPMLKRDLGFTEFTGTVALLEALPDGRRITLSQLQLPKLRPQQTPATIRLTDRKADSAITIGDRVSGKAFLRAISEPVLPGDYDFRRNAFFNNLGATGFLAGPLIVVQPSSRWFNFNAARAKLATEIRARLQGDAGAISNALLTGDQEGIGQDTLEAMRLSGLTHILSVSGLHIGLAAGLLFFLVRALLALSPALALRYPIKKYAAVAALAGAWAYTMFAGAPVPAVRSLLMTGIALLAIVVDRDALSLRTVALSAIVILLIVPDALTGPSFQLSYAAIVAIIAAYEGSEDLRAKIERPRNIILRGLLYVGAIALTSLIASLATAPLTYYHFQQLSFYGVIANMLAVPLTSFWLMPAALLALFLLPFGLSDYPLLILGKGVELLMLIAARTAALPGADWAPANLPLAAMLCMVVGGLWLLLWRLRWRWFGLLPVAAGLVLALFPQQPQVLIAGDGRYIALRTDTGYALISDSGKRHMDSFVPEQWRRWLGVRIYEDGTTLCDSLACHYGAVTIVRDASILPEVCGEQTETVIYPVGRLQHCGAIDIDEPQLWRGGSLTLYKEGALDTTQAHIGYRPWSLRSPWHERPGYKRDQ